MITNAKVSQASVKAFNQEAVRARDYSEKLSHGILSLQGLLHQLSEMERQLCTEASKLQTAKKQLTIKIKDIRAVIENLTAQLNILQGELSDLESQLENTKEYITVTDSDGHSREESNPAYDELKMEIDAVENEISTLEIELFPHQQRLDRATNVDGRLSAHADAVESVIYSLQEKQNSCRRLISNLEDIQSSNIRKSSYAVENLTKIEKIIDQYLKIKMDYTSRKQTNYDNSQKTADRININVNINKTTIVEQNPSNSESQEQPQTPTQKIVSELKTLEQTLTDVELQESSQPYTKEEIKKHRIKFDADGHVCEYDGKKFGCTYNSYEDCIKGTSVADNPISGSYEGERGESKFIPSGRSAEGVAVIKILEKYGVDGIVYRNGEPDFEVCKEAVVTIASMSGHRDNYMDDEGNTQYGNFTQADIECAKAWNKEKKDGKSDWEARDIFNYRKANGLTWHEKCDTKTMVMVPKEINAYFKHVGGCSECRLRDAENNSEDEFDE